MSKNYLLIYSEQLATEIELLCQNIKARAVFMPTFVKQITDKASQIWFQSLK